MNWPHRLILERKAVSAGATGGYAAGATETVYDGLADVQDAVRAYRTSEGRTVDTHEAKCFLPKFGIDIQPGDSGEVAYPDGRRVSVTVRVATEGLITLVLQ